MATSRAAYRPSIPFPPNTFQSLHFTLLLAATRHVNPELPETKPPRVSGCPPLHLRPPKLPTPSSAYSCHRPQLSLAPSIFTLIPLPALRA
ncbi:hypothetical protein L209DRAFT_754636 [Thermothelomyces heterothallicus CBS 203.75]